MCQYWQKLFSKSFNDHCLNNFWHSLYELMSWVWMHMILRINNYIWGLATVQHYLIVKWIKGDVGQRKFLHSCGRFLCEEGKKPQKLLMIPGGSFGGSSVGVWGELWIRASVASPPLPPSHILAALRQQVNSFAQSDLIFGRGVFLRFFLAKETLKLWKVITCLKNSRLKN